MKPPTKPAPRRRKHVAIPILTSHIPDRPKVEGEPHMVGYARVSMSDQNNQRQIGELVRFGVGAVDIFSDTGSGKSMDRPGWKNCWRNLREGDMLVVHSIDRLGCNLEEVLRVERELRERGCTLKSLKEDLNTATPTGRLMFHIIAAIAQWEREWSLERTMHGLAKARERGVIGGATKDARWPVDKVVAAVAEFGVNGAVRHLGCSKPTVIRRMKEHEEQKRKEAQTDE